MDVIATHVNADFDCLGSMIAAKRLYPEAVLVFPGGQEQGLRNFLLQSTLYAYNIKRSKDIDLAEVTRLILVDVRSTARIGLFADIVDRPGLDIHIYDHHPEDKHALRGSLEEIHDVGATTTILTRIFKERGIVPDSDEATMMMLGIFEDTGHLLFSGTTPADYEAAAFLLEHGANLNTVADFLVREMTPEQVALLNELLNSCRTVIVNGVEIAISHASVDYYVGDISSLVHKLKDIENLDVLIVAVRMEDRIFTVGRSRLPEVHVGEVFQELGGGGHAFAASATVRDMPLAQLLDHLQALLQKHVQPSGTAGELMSSPVKTLPEVASIDKARQLMARFNFNAVPIVDDRHQVVGIITRQIVEKAAHHKLARMAVGDVMNSDFKAVSSSASLAELQQGIIEHNQRCVPVVDGGTLVGVVTRTDLLRHMLGDQQERLEGPTGILAQRSLQLKRKNLKRLLEAQLPNYIKTILHRLGEVADRQQVKVFLVGGCVRDLLLRQENLDIDVVVEGNGIGFARQFAATVDCRIREHEKFGTAVVIFPDGFKVDIASARLEYYDSPAALPHVEHASIRQDLYRRDFTINTLTIALNRENFGQMLDFFGGQRDLKDKAIRVLHNLSFVEDPTRLFRAVRFEQRLGFRIGRQTERLMRSAVRMNLVKRVGGARILNELEQILSEAHILPALERLEQFELLKFIDRRLKIDAPSRKLLIAAGRAANWFDLLYTGEPYRRWLLYLVCLFGQQSEKTVSGIIRWLNVHPRDQELFLEKRSRSLVLLKKLKFWKAKQAPPTNSDIFHWFEGLPLELILFLMASAEDEVLQKWISLYVTRLRNVKIALTGQDLINLGLQPGPYFQDIFRVVLDARLNMDVTSKEEEIGLALKNFPA